MKHFPSTSTLWNCRLYLKCVYIIYTSKLCHGNFVVLMHAELQSVSLKKSLKNTKKIKKTPILFRSYTLHYPISFPDNGSGFSTEIESVLQLLLSNCKPDESEFCAVLKVKPRLLNKTKRAQSLSFNSVDFSTAPPMIVHPNKPILDNGYFGKVMVFSNTFKYYSKSQSLQTKGRKMEKKVFDI